MLWARALNCRVIKQAPHIYLGWDARNVVKCTSSLRSQSAKHSSIGTIYVKRAQKHACWRGSEVSMDLVWGSSSFLSADLVRIEISAKKIWTDAISLLLKSDRPATQQCHLGTKSSSERVSNSIWILGPQALQNFPEMHVLTQPGY